MKPNTNDQARTWLELERAHALQNAASAREWAAALAERGEMAKAASLRAAADAFDRVAAELGGRHVG